MVCYDWSILIGALLMMGAIAVVAGLASFGVVLVIVRAVESFSNPCRGLR